MRGQKVISQMQEKGTFHPKTYVVKTIDGFQGQEADVVIISTVRCNEYGRLGFLMVRTRCLCPCRHMGHLVCGAGGPP